MTDPITPAELDELERTWRGIYLTDVARKSLAAQSMPRLIAEVRRLREDANAAQNVGTSEQSPTNGHGGEG